MRMILHALNIAEEVEFSVTFFVLRSVFLPHLNDQTDLSIKPLQDNCYNY